MKAIRYLDAKPTVFDNEQARRVTGRVVIGKAEGAKNFCMRVFEVAASGHTPKHSHAWEHEMFYHSGHGEVLCDGQWNAVGPGSVMYVPGGAEHQVRNTGPEPLVFVCLVPSVAPEM